MKKILIVYGLFCLLVSAVSAETIVSLKSGKVIKGKLVELEDEYIQIDDTGVPLTYWMDTIESIKLDDGMMIYPKKDSEITNETGFNAETFSSEGTQTTAAEQTAMTAQDGQTISGETTPVSVPAASGEDAAVSEETQIIKEDSGGTTFLIRPKYPEEKKTTVYRPKYEDEEKAQAEKKEEVVDLTEQFDSGTPVDSLQSPDSNLPGAALNNIDVSQLKNINAQDVEKFKQLFGVIRPIAAAVGIDVSKSGNINVQDMEKLIKRISGIIAVIGIFVYIYISLCLQMIALKTKTAGSWLAWIPIANLYLMCVIAGKPWWWLLLFFLPFVNIVINIILWMGIAQARGKPGWIGILMILQILPILNIIPVFIIGYLAFSK